MTEDYVRTIEFTDLRSRPEDPFPVAVCRTVTLDGDIHITPLAGSRGPYLDEQGVLIVELDLPADQVHVPSEQEWARGPGPNRRVLVGKKPVLHLPARPLPLHHADPDAAPYAWTVTFYARRVTMGAPHLGPQPGV